MQKQLCFSAFCSFLCQRQYHQHESYSSIQYGILEAENLFTNEISGFYFRKGFWIWELQNELEILERKKDTNKRNVSYQLASQLCFYCILNMTVVEWVELYAPIFLGNPISWIMKIGLQRFPFGKMIYMFGVHVAYVSWMWSSKLFSLICL